MNFYNLLLLYFLKNIDYLDDDHNAPVDYPFIELLII